MKVFHTRIHNIAIKKIRLTIYSSLIQILLFRYENYVEKYYCDAHSTWTFDALMFKKLSRVLF